MNSNLPSISTDCNGKQITVTVGEITVFFSYTTPVGFLAPGLRRVVSQNVWSQTTGRHLNAIDGGGSYKDMRVPHDLFRLLLALVTDGSGPKRRKAASLLAQHDEGALTPAQIQRALRAA
jgi:hypothetical protein